MAIVDTHEAFERLTGAGFSKDQAETLIQTVGESRDVLATKADLESLAQATKADIDSLARQTKADIDALAQQTKADIDALAQQTKADITAVQGSLRELELRLRLQMYGVAVVVIGVLTALEFIPR